jgi:hypothetical protein
MEAELVKTAKSNQIPQCVLDAIQGIEKLLGSKTTFLAPSINIAAVKAIVSASPRLPCNNPSTPRSFILHRNRFICRGEIPKGFAPRPNCFRPSIVSRTTSADGSLSGSPFAPTLSSDLLRFWGEDPNQGGDRIAKQFWGDIFAKLLQGSAEELTRVRNASRLFLLLMSLLLALLLVTASRTASCHASRTASCHASRTASCRR